MKSTITILCLFLYIPSFPISHAKENLPSRIENKIREKGLSKSSLALVISEIQSPQKVVPVYSLNESRLFVPASLVKIASLSALQELYPASYTFKTRFASSAIINKGVLQGDLILKGGGDSSFTSESLWNLTNVLTRTGIKQIHGNLLIDDTLYNKEKSRILSERSYHSPMSASSFNWNSVAFYIQPASRLKAPARIFSDSENSYIQIINRVTTGKKNKIKIKRRSTSPTKEIFEIKGEIDIHKEEIVKYRNISQPALWLGYNSLSFLKQRGIRLSGKVKRGTCSGSCKTLAEWESRPLPFHFYNLMKYSSNFTAKMLTAHLPLLYGDKKGDLHKGMDQMRHFIKSQNLAKNFRFKDPSGLDRKNKWTAKDLQNLLIRSQNHFYSPEILSSYPLAGGSGTLKKRFKNSSSVPLLRAKTGSLYKVRGLAGWIGSPKHKNSYVFVFIFNGNNSKSQNAEDLFYDIIKIITKKPKNL